MNTVAIVAFIISALASLVSLHFALVARIHGRYAAKFRQLGQSRGEEGS